MLRTGKPQAQLSLKEFESSVQRSFHVKTLASFEAVMDRPIEESRTNKLLDLSEKQVVRCAVQSLRSCVSSGYVTMFVSKALYVQYKSGTTCDPRSCDKQCQKKPLDIGSSSLVHGEAAFVSAAVVVVQCWP
ncbi:hypothetical protein H310_14560 [Aphanomyces invadans]|uniref:Uncharacterized protein n=1 Tax=Aphanomyces invadans TaxID=157072 RepID=A0A024T9K0_9STRA|nr:hypothetical protein H310_14560 [Aphanomyces invadans]ETV90723.1 hypothetical protein H310_14560 [Aphanomyces invadans]|eukprot:XP_008880663.1 hypothetical protein H310_14560 [Aphanomyces invadans]